MTLRGQFPTDDPVFPDEYDFGFAQIGEGKYPAKIQGDTIVLEYANARATYKVTGPLRLANGDRGADGYVERPDLGFHAELDADSVEHFDAPAVTEEGIAAYQATRSDVDEEPQEPGTTVAKAGTPTITPPSGDDLDATSGDEV